MSWTRGRVEAALEEIARTEVPAPRPEFVAGVERRLAGRAAMPAARPTPVPVRVPLVLRLAAAAAVVVGVVIVLDQRPGREVRLVTPAASTSSTSSSESAPATTPTTLVPDPPFIAIAPTTTTKAADRQGPAPSTTSTTGAKPVADTRSKPPPDGEPRQTTTTTRAGDPERTTTTTSSEAGAATPSSSSLRLACGPLQDRDAIACSWSEGPAGTAGFKLWREVPGEARRAVYAVKDPNARRYLDTAVSAGVTYTYLIEALDESGRVLARGGPVEVTCC